MHDIRLSIANDYIQQEYMAEAWRFHSASANRFDPIVAEAENFVSLSESQIRTMEWGEFRFGGKTTELAPIENPELRSNSCRLFENKSPISYQKLSNIIGSSIVEHKRGVRLIRPYASGGALYSVNAILHLRNVSGFEKGSYHVLPKSEKLERLDASVGDISETLFGSRENVPRNYDFAILYVAVPQIPIAKYGLRGYRLILLEAGAAIHAATLSAEKHGVRQLTWGGFDDDGLAVAMGIDPRAAWPLMVQLFGRTEP